jgi:hypothetical protein
MTDDYDSQQARRLLGYHEEEQFRFTAQRQDSLHPTKTAPPDPASAQVHATLAVASQLARIATALERLAGEQKGPSPQ